MSNPVEDDASWEAFLGRYGDMLREIENEVLADEEPLDLQIPLRGGPFYTWSQSRDGEWHVTVTVSMPSEHAEHMLEHDTCWESFVEELWCGLEYHVSRPDEEDEDEGEEDD